MSKSIPWQTRLSRSKWLPTAVILLSIAVLGTVIFIARHRLRQTVREQIAQSNGEVLYSAVLLLQQRANEELAGTNRTGPTNRSETAEAVVDIANPGVQFDLLLEASKLRGVLGVRLFSPEGEFLHRFPDYIPTARLTADDLARLHELKAVCHFEPDAPMSEIVPGEESKLSLLKANIPLHRENDHKLVGVAQFLIEGATLAAEYAALDHNLTRQAEVAFLTSSGFLVLVLGWTFRCLAERTANLQRANEQLAMAAKTSALGAVTAHLLHGLKNPLAGLQTFVSSRGAPGGENDVDWNDAVAATRRMQTMIHDVVRVLREEEEGSSCEITVPELADLVAAKVGLKALDVGVYYESEVKAGGNLSSRTASLICLILVNLVENAIQASSRGKKVTLSLVLSGDMFVCAVQDEGPGLAEELRANLFAPGRSSKEGGSGIGLAISKQLAHHLGAELELVQNGPGGCRFILRLDKRLMTDESRLAFQAAL